MIKQHNILSCKSHPNRPVTYIYLQKDCPLPSRLACNKCWDEKHKDGLIDYIDFLENPFQPLTLQNRVQGIFDELHNFFQFLMQDPIAIVEQFQNNINNLIEQLKKKIEIQTDERKKFCKMIQQAKDQFLEALKYQQLIEKLEKISTIFNCHQSNEWEEIEQALKEYATQFIDQENQELRQTLYSLQQNQQEYFEKKTFIDFNDKSMKLFEDLRNQFKELTGSFSSILNDATFYRMLSNKISEKKLIKAKLLFKGTQDGMNAKSFWNKCENQGPTLVICQSQNGNIFGGYSPCKWISNSQYQPDPSLKSFLFNYNRQEFYSLVQQEYSIYGNQSYGPAFGGGHDLGISNNFQDGYSNLGFSYQVDNKKQIQNEYNKIDLMGSEKPNLVEMEVYRID